MWKLKVGNIFDEKKRFCFVYGIIWPQIWPWKLSACVHELVRSEKERSFVLYTPKKHILFETQREFILNEDASYWLVASVRCNQFEKCASCISIELRFANAHPLQCTGFTSMKKFFLGKVLYKKSTSTLSPCISCVKWWLYFQMHKLLSSLYRKIPRRENQTF